MAFLENQGRSDLNARFLLPRRSIFFRVEPVRDIGALTFEGYTGRFHLLRDERGEINVHRNSGQRLVLGELGAQVVAKLNNSR
jgi:hypothetical protein